MDGFYFFAERMGCCCHLQAHLSAHLQAHFVYAMLIKLMIVLYRYQV